MSRGIRRILAVSTLLGFAAEACGPPDKVISVYPETDIRVAHAVFDGIAFTQQITVPDNFVLRPDEFGIATVDSKRGLIYVGSREGTLLALSDQNGAVMWEKDLGGAISSQPVVVDDVGEGAVAREALLLVGTDNGDLVALDLGRREIAWRYHTDGRVRNAAVEHEGVAYFANSRDQIFALDVRTGEWRWQYEQEFQTDFTVAGRAGLTLVPTVGDTQTADIGTLYTGFDNGKVVALAAGTGEVLWLQSVAPAEGGNFVDCDSTPLVDPKNRRVIVAGQSTGVFALSMEDGAITWRFDIDGAHTIVPGPGNDLFGASSLEGVFALDQRGNRLWLTQVDPGVISKPLVVEQTVYVTHSDIGLLAFDASTGSVLAHINPGSGMSAQPTFDVQRGLLIATSNRGALIALRILTSGRDRNEL